MLIALYTSRIILRVLGVEDYGIYNAVGGVVVFFTVLDSAMNASCQRFLNFEMGKNNEDGVREVFCSSINIQAIISVTVFIITEVAGLILLFKYMTIPDGRLTAAFWIFQCSVLTMVVNTMSIPYNAMLIAKEKMTAFAYIDIVNTVLKLLAVLLLQLMVWDKLILYAILMLAIQVGTRYIYTAYCNKHFNEVKYKYHWNRYIIKQMLGFSFWTVFSSVASMLLTQGMSILYNIYYGVIANAAIGIGNQVMMAVRKLTGNLAISFAPQIVKRYSSGEYDKVAMIWSIGTKCTILLFAVFSFPIIFNVDYILNLWLNNVPPNASIFVILFLIENLIRCFTGNCSAIVRATGKIKEYELVTNTIKFFSFGLVCIGFVLFDNISIPLYIYIFNTIIQLFYNVHVGCKCIKYSVMQYYWGNVVLMILSLGVAVSISYWLLPEQMTIISFIIHIISTICILVFSFVVIGLQVEERRYLLKNIQVIITQKRIRK